MRRPFVLLSSVAIACVTITLASAATASPQIICPVAATGGPPIGTCCEPPVAVTAAAAVTPISCCPVNAAICAQGLSIGSAPNPSVAARKVVISGRLFTGAGSGPVVIWQRLPGQRRFHELLVQMPDGSGQYAATVTPTTNREWYATALGVRSITMQQHVQAVVTLVVSAIKGASVGLRCRVSPSHPRQRVLLEVRSGSRWTVVARVRLDTHSRMHVRLSSRASGPMVVKAVLPGDSRNVQSSSPPVTIP